MVASISQQFKSWDPKNDAEFENGACGKCQMQACLEEEGGFTVWECRHGSWFMPKEVSYACASERHTVAECPGNCSQHPLFKGAALELTRRMTATPELSWGNVCWEEEQRYLASETAEQKTARLAKEAADDVASKGRLINFAVHKKEDKWCDKSGEMKFRVPRPCKYATLFAKRECAACGAKVPELSKFCGAMKNGRQCCEELAGCWNHEKTRTCIYVHPDEEQWQAACDGTLCYDRERSCFHLRGAALPVVNRFAAAVRDERPRQQGHGRSQGQNQGRRY